MASGNTVHGRFLRSARRHPSRVALELPSAQFTYAQVRAMATAAARRLQARGVARGCVVATCVDEGHLMIITQLAVLLAGGCCGGPATAASGGVRPGSERRRATQRPKCTKRVRSARALSLFSHVLARIPPTC